MNFGEEGLRTCEFQGNTPAASWVRAKALREGKGRKGILRKEKGSSMYLMSTLFPFPNSLACFAFPWRLCVNPNTPKVCFSEILA